VFQLEERKKKPKQAKALDEGKYFSFSFFLSLFVCCWSKHEPYLHQTQKSVLGETISQDVAASL
jgi:hypothetical protein